jgi:uncharacterized membrane protein YebE (DUF533 family)
MAEFDFACPQCGQNIRCDQLWSGHQIQCPSCQQEISVPQASAPAGNPLVPKPPSGGGSKLSLGHDQTRQPAVPKGNIPVRNLAPKKEKKQSALLQALAYIVVLAALGAGAYYGYSWYKQRAEAKAEEAERAAHPPPPPAPPPPPPVVYTLDVDSANTPNFPVNGTISGAKFKAETVRVDKVGAAEVLRFTQGALTAPDGEVLIYLNLKPGQSLAGQTLTVSKDAKTGGEISQVVKRWKANGAPQPPKPFPSGYALKLEIGTLTNNTLPGKIFLALPDPEQTVIAGTFQATPPGM